MPQINALENINGWDPSHRHRYYSDFIHWVKHVYNENADLKGIVTLDDYLKLAQRIGRSVAREDPGTYFERRGNNDLIVYIETPEIRRYTNPPLTGIFMVVSDWGTQGKLQTIFAPKEGLDYFMKPDQRRLI